MRYERKFMIQAAHFNNEQTYKNYYNALDTDDQSSAVALFCSVIENLHGHNFFITVEVTGVKGQQPWLIDDIELSKIVMEWDNKNLSVHSDFLQGRLRATTENMASLLCRKLVCQSFRPILNWKVTVEETPSIKASHEAENTNQTSN